MSLTSIQQASCELSVEWKRQGRKLLDQALTLTDFQKAVQWIGNRGSASRTVTIQSFPAFVNDLFIHKNEIMNGTFQIDSLNYNQKKPISWTSKICHIMNPKDYPIIYDSKTNKTLKIRSFEMFKKELKKYQKKVIDDNMTDLQIYLQESVFWAEAL